LSAEIREVNSSARTSTLQNVGARLGGVDVHQKNNSEIEKAINAICGTANKILDKQDDGESVLVQMSGRGDISILNATDKRDGRKMTDVATKDSVR
jgi:hypothetical protein